MPLNRLAAAYVISLIFLIWLLGFPIYIKSGIHLFEKQRWILLSFSLVYIVYLLGLIHTSNTSYAWADLQTKFSLLLFPLVFAMIGDSYFNQKKIHALFWTYISGLALCTIICLVNATVRFADTHSRAMFYYTNLSWFQHATYLSMYLDFAIAMLFYFLLYRQFQLKYKLLMTAGIIYFSVFIILLSSKAGIITLIIVVLAVASYTIFFRKQKIYGLTLIVSAIVFFIIVSFLFPYYYDRVERTRKALKNYDPGMKTSEESTDNRLLIWQSAIEIVGQHPVSGVGTGDVKDALLEKYQEKGMNDALTHRLNAHNQYLQTTVALGLMGLIILILALIVPVVYAIKYRNFLYLILIAIVAFNWLFESMLEGQNGVVFYAFFNAFLFYKIKELRKSELTVNLSSVS
jgi:O-antigen ligase